MCVRERPLPCVTDGLYSEAVAAGLRQSLDFVGVAGTAVDRHEPGQRTKRGKRVRKCIENGKKRILGSNSGSVWDWNGDMKLQIKPHE